MEVITRDTNHYYAGQSNPEKPDGLIRLYSMKFCPFAERTRLVLLAKKLPHEIINIDLRRKPNWFLEIYSKGTVPVLDTDNEIIPESIDTCDYLEEKYPEPRLYSTDPEARQHDKELINKFNEVLGAFYGSLRNTKTPFAEHAAKLIQLLQEYENELAVRGDFFGGKNPGMLDFMVWPWAERAEIIDSVYGEKFPLPEGQLSKIRGWCGRMKKLDIIKNTMITSETACRAFQHYESGKFGSFDNI